VAELARLFLGGCGIKRHPSHVYFIAWKYKYVADFYDNLLIKQDFACLKFVGYNLKVSRRRQVFNTWFLNILWTICRNIYDMSFEIKLPLPRLLIWRYLLTLPISAEMCTMIFKRHQLRMQDIPGYQEKSRNVLGQFYWIHQESDDS
jgi:hypothetical protein